MRSGLADASLLWQLLMLQPHQTFQYTYLILGLFYHLLGLAELLRDRSRLERQRLLGRLHLC